MHPFALPRASRRPVAVRSYFHQPRTRVVSTVNPFRPDIARIALAVVIGFQLVMLVACAVLA
ncbi:MAG TPA: hypothetical protein VFB63_19555 [Bryobacteraceae bacterium]|nr:hypothetical protein [Bryobacteraceae bacterium]